MIITQPRYRLIEPHRNEWVIEHLKTGFTSNAMKSVHFNFKAKIGVCWPIDGQPYLFDVLAYLFTEMEQYKYSENKYVAAIFANE